MAFFDLQSFYCFVKTILLIHHRLNEKKTVRQALGVALFLGAKIATRNKPGKQFRQPEQITTMENKLLALEKQLKALEQ